MAVSVDNSLSLRLVFEQMLSIEQQSELKQLLGGSKKIVVTSHNNPDGDAMGSLLGMYHYLRKKGHRVVAVVPNQFPEFYNWLPGSSDVLIYEKSARQVQKHLAEAELIFCLDYNGISRFGAPAEILAKAPGKRIMIDHHVDPEPENFDYCISIVNTSSTGELVYDFIKIMGDGNLLDKPIADCLYTSIITDTGSFSYSANNQGTYHVTAELIDLGVDAAQVHRLIYDTFTENRLRLLGFGISERMVVWDEFHTAMIYLTKEDLKKFSYRVGDTEGLVNYPLMMGKINMSILLTEKDNMIRMSFRSKGDFSVNLFVRKHFKGGGHRNAAGGKSFIPLEKTIERIKGVLPEYKQALNYNINY